MGTGFAFVLLAWVLFSLAMPKHQQAVLARTLPLRATPWLRMAGGCLLAAGLAICIAARGWSQGPIFWGALLILSAIAWILLLTFAPRRGVVATVVIALAGSLITLL